MKNKMTLIFLLIITLFNQGLSSQSKVTESRNSTDFKKVLVGEWTYEIGGICTGGGPYDSSIIREKGTFNFSKDFSFSVSVDDKSDSTEKGIYKIVDFKIIRLFFENNKKNEEIFLEFNNERESDVIWRINRRDKLGNHSERMSEVRALIMTKNKDS